MHSFEKSSNPTYLCPTLGRRLFYSISPRKIKNKDPKFKYLYISESTDCNRTNWN